MVAKLSNKQKKRNKSNIALRVAVTARRQVRNSDIGNTVRRRTVDTVQFSWWSCL